MKEIIADWLRKTYKTIDRNGSQYIGLQLYSDYNREGYLASISVHIWLQDNHLRINNATILYYNDPDLYDKIAQTLYDILHNWLERNFDHYEEKLATWDPRKPCQT